MLRFNGTKVPPEYEARFQLALWAFRHARVYCTAEKVCGGIATGWLGCGPDAAASLPLRQRPACAGLRPRLECAGACADTSARSPSPAGDDSPGAPAWRRHWRC